MKILILGSEGFIGKACVNFFSKKDIEIYGVDLIDIPLPKYNYTKVLPPEINYSKIFSDIKPDFCINTIGSTNIAFSFESPFSDFESNSTQLFKVLDNIRLHAPLCKVVHFSSAAVYGNPDTLPIDENIKPNPLSVYGFHKLISENIANEFYKIYGVKSICLRPFSVYGPGQKKLLFWDIYKKHMNEESIKLFGTGNETRDFIYIEDLILALELCMNNAEFNAQSINIACGNEISIREAATIFCKALETDKALIFSNNVKKGDPLRWKADISKLTSLGFVSNYNMESGLYNYAEWLKK